MDKTARFLVRSLALGYENIWEEARLMRERFFFFKISIMWPSQNFGWKSTVDLLVFRSPVTMVTSSPSLSNFGQRNSHPVASFGQYCRVALSRHTKINSKPFNKRSQEFQILSKINK